MAGTNAAKRDFRPDIEGLRGLAVLLVVAYHAGLPITGGYVGVDVFFVLSGYLITGLILKEVAESGRVRFLAFYGRRIRRLVPAAALVLLATLGLAWLVLSPLELATLSRTAAAVAVYLGNFRFATSAVDYQQAGQADPFIHTWSLAVEEQFYLAWPVLIALLVVLGRLVSRRAALVAGIALLSVVSFALCVRWTNTVQPWAFFLSPFRAWEFGVGALAVMAPDAWYRGRANRLLGLAGMAAVLVAALAYDDHTLFPGVLAALPAFGTAAILMGARARPDDPIYAPLRIPLLQWLGRYSYSWYLWHWPLIVFTRTVWRDASTAATLTAAVVSLLAAVATYKLVERPVRFNPRLTRRPGLSVALGIALAVGGLGIASASEARARAVARTGEQRIFAELKNQRRTQEGCGVPLRTTAARACIFGDRDSAETMVLFGDSKATVWVPAADRVARARGWRLVILAKVACPIADLAELRSLQLRRPYRECTVWRERAVREILRLRPALTLLASSDAYVARPGGGTRHRVDAGTWEDGLRATMARLDAAGLPQVLLLDAPIPGFDVATCLSRAEFALIATRDCTFDRDQSLHPAARNAAEAAVRGLSRARTVDMADRICASPRCPVRSADTIFYSDDSHISLRYSAQLGPALDERVTAALARIVSRAP